MSNWNEITQADVCMNDMGNLTERFKRNLCEVEALRNEVSDLKSQVSYLTKIFESSQLSVKDLGTFTLDPNYKDINEP